MTGWRAVTRFGGLVAIVTLTLALVATGWWRHLSPAELQGRYRDFAATAASRPFVSLGVFTLLSGLLTAACLPATGVLVVLGGALFGALTGGLASLVGSVAGSTVVFLACRSAAAGWKGAGSDGRVARLMAGFSRRAFSTLLVLRLTPVAPLSVVNIAAGFARVRLAPFVAASLIGSAPSNLIYAGLGAGLRGALQKGVAFDPATLADPRLIWPLAALAALAGAAALYKLRDRR